VPPKRRREIHPLRIALIVTVVGGLVVAAIYVPYHRKRAGRLAVQQACLTYTQPADQVAYDEKPPRAAELLARGGGDYTSAPGDGQPIAGHVPGVWREMCRWALPNDADAPRLPVLFLHERRTASGMHGLVCVQVDRANRRLRITFVSPAGERLDPVAVVGDEIVPLREEGLIMLGKDDGPLAGRLPSGNDAAQRADLRFFAGQVDPRDETHVRLPYEWENMRGTIDLWIQTERSAVYADQVSAAATTRASG
jgi:hypothetical protein